jgi:hypothetical protein
VLLDSSGQTTVLFPREGAEESQIRAATSTATPEIVLNTVEIGPPFGVDTYILLVTKDPLPDPFVLNSQGVQGKSRGAPRGGLESLVFSMQDGVRGARSAEPIPKNWHISRLETISRP